MENKFQLTAHKPSSIMSKKISQDTTSLYEFAFKVTNPALAPYTHLKLFNGYNEIVNEGYGQMNVKIPKGLYQLRIEMNEYVEDRNYRVTTDVKDNIDDIKTTSATPLEGFSSTHEYFSHPSAEWSTKSTKTKRKISGSSIFLFLRYSDNEKPFGQISRPEKGFLILNENREIIFELDKTNTICNSGRESEFYGSIAFHERIPTGQYYMVYKGKNIKREIQLYVFEGWQTQLFMMMKETPVFATTRISIERNGFSSRNRQNLQLDALTQKMHNGIYFLPEDLKRAAAHGKWENPMLGIIACYMYLMTSDTKDDKLFSTILKNLQENILRNKTAPEFIALRLLGAVHFKQQIPAEVLPAPTMILAGMNAFLKQSFTDQNLIEKGSIVEKIFQHMRSDSIWTTYEPLPIRQKKQKKIASEDAASKHQPALPMAMKNLSLNKPVETGYHFKPENDWITSTIFSQLSESNTPLDISTIASQLQITHNTVKSALSKMNKTGMLTAVANSVLENKPGSKKFTDSLTDITNKINNLIK